MDIHKAKMLQKLRGSYQVGMLLLPLIDACQKYRELPLSTEQPTEPGLLLKTVFAASNKVYQEISQKDGFVADPSLVMNSLNILFSKALRNNMVLYGSTDLDVLVDDISAMFSKHLTTLQQWAGPIEREVSGNESTLSNAERTKVMHDIIGYISSYLLTLLTPFFLFHANLHLVGRIDLGQLQTLNAKCSSHMMQMVISLKETIEEKQPNASSFFSVHSLVLCADICSMHCHELHTRILRSTEDVERYISDPSPFLAMIAPSVMSSFSIMNSETLKVMNDLVKGL